MAAVAGLGRVVRRRSAPIRRALLFDCPGATAYNLGSGSLRGRNQFVFTEQVATPPVVGAVGVFFATAQHLQNTFTAHGPYLQASWAF